MQSIKSSYNSNYSHVLSAGIGVRTLFLSTIQMEFPVSDAVFKDEEDWLPAPKTAAGDAVAISDCDHRSSRRLRAKKRPHYGRSLTTPLLLVNRRPRAML